MNTFRFAYKSLAVLVLVALVGAAGWMVLRPKVVRAQSSGCTASSLNAATYTYTLNGFYYDSNFNVYFYGDIGVMTPDGNGNVSGSDTVSNDGTVSRRTFSGTYTVNDNCTGSAKINYSAGGSLGFDLVISNAGKSVSFIDTDSGVVVTGTATPQ